MTKKLSLILALILVFCIIAAPAAAADGENELPDIDITSWEYIVANSYNCIVYYEPPIVAPFLGQGIDSRIVEPLLDFLDSGHDFSGFSAADKTVGAGAAHLYVALGIKAVWANVISEIGIKILKENNIHVSFNECVPHIINRKGDGICPIENSVKDISSTDTAIEKIRKTLQNLS